MKIFFALIIVFLSLQSFTVKTPTNLKECLIELDQFLSNEDQDKFLEYDENSLFLAYDMSLGNYIRNSWIFDEESDLYQYFSEMCITEMNQMSHIILVSYHRMKSKKLINLEDQIKELIGEKEFKKCGSNVSLEKN